MNKRKLIIELQNQLESDNYKKLPLTPKGAGGAFYKFIGSYFLTLGIEFSSFYEERFTGSFYLSKTFTWSYAPPRYFPTNGYCRVGDFLRKEERLELLSPEFLEKGIIDAWWIGFTPENIQLFIKAVNISEKRFLDQKDLYKGIDDSEVINKIIKVVEIFRIENTTFKIKNNGTDMNYIFEWVKITVNSNKDFNIWNHKKGIQFLTNEIWLQLSLLQ